MPSDGVIKICNPRLIETRGGVKFYKVSVTNKEYQLVDREFIKVKDGNAVYGF